MWCANVLEPTVKVAPLWSATQAFGSGVLGSISACLSKELAFELLLPSTAMVLVKTGFVVVELCVTGLITVMAVISLVLPLLRCPLGLPTTTFASEAAEAAEAAVISTFFATGDEELVCGEAICPLSLFSVSVFFAAVVVVVDLVLTTALVLLVFVLFDVARMCLSQIGFTTSGLGQDLDGHLILNQKTR